MKRIIFVILLSSISSLWMSNYALVNDTDYAPLRLNALCDEWHTLRVYSGPIKPFADTEFETDINRLTTDTIIGDKRYVKLEQADIYRGALREDDNANVYYIPAGSTHEHLLYAFHGQVGDSLTDLWIGGPQINYTCNGTITDISETYPRVFTLQLTIRFHYDGYEESENLDTTIRWIEGVGLEDEPCGAVCPAVLGCAGSPTDHLLCAYRNGENIYTSDWGERYGCNYNYDPNNDTPLRFKSLCDEWNMFVVPFSEDPNVPYYTYAQHLTTDTLINGLRYVKLERAEIGQYIGAMREKEDSVLYFIPAGSNHEYLLYDFTVQVNDTLTNIWVGGDEEIYPTDGLKAIVCGVHDNIITMIYYSEDPNSDVYKEDNIYYNSWIKGVGMTYGPAGWYVFPGMAVDPKPELLCAFKDGKKVYGSEYSLIFGCYFNGTTPPSRDTIPLNSFTGDDPGSSTVEPVDPNQVVAILLGDELTIREASGDEITYSLSNYSSSNVAAKAPMTRSDSFRNEVSVLLSEEGSYDLRLTNPNWDYTIIGVFNYPYRHSAIETIETAPQTNSAQKIFRNNTIYILRNNKIYTIEGQEVE